MYPIQFSALGDATRCRIIEMLSVDPLPVHTMAQAFSISRPAISRHLRVLKEAGLVIEEKQGRENVYRLVAGPMEPLRAWLALFDGKKPAKRKGREKARPEPAVEIVAAVAAPPPVIEPVKQIRKKPKSPEPVSQSQMAWEF